MITGNDVIEFIDLAEAHIAAGQLEQFKDAEGLIQLPCGDFVEQVPNALPGVYRNLEV